MTQHWTLADLLARFPELLAGVGARPTDTTTGRGRYIKEAGGRRHCADVSVEGRPAEQLTITLGHEWPPEVAEELRTDLDHALVGGLFEAVLRHEPAALGCHLVTTGVVYHQDTSDVAVRIAASMAFQDMARKTDWSPRTPTGPVAA
jgi:hypothetical protein